MERRPHAKQDLRPVAGPGPTPTDTLNASKDSWINRHASATSPSNGTGAIASSNPSQYTSSTQSATVTSASSGIYNWRLTRAVIKNGTLTLYKAPTDLSIKSFDTSLPRPVALNSPLSNNTFGSGGGGGATLPKSPSFSSNHKRIVSSVSLPPKAMAAAAGLGGSAGGPFSLSYKGYDVHPDIAFDSQGNIINGSLEAICHTILFGDDDDFSSTAVLTIPLLGDVVVALEMLKEYVSSVRPLGHGSGLAGSPTADTIAKRVQLIVITVLNNFKGMLLNNSIHASLQQLADSVSSYNDQISTALKLSIFQEHQRMNKMLTYTREDTEVLWSMQQKVTDNMSEKLHAFLGRIDSGVDHGNSNGGSQQSYHQSHQQHQQQLLLQQQIQQQQLSIPPDLFLELTSTDFLATQVSLFHLKFYKQWSPAIDISLLFKTDYNYNRYNPLIFDSRNIHFLGALLLDHLLGTKYSKLDNAYRGKLLTHWINLGNTLKSSGDYVGWIAIVTAVCSPPILRLRESWSYVPADLRENVGKDWGHELFELERRSKMDLMSKRTFRVSTEDIGVAFPKERSISFFADLTVKPIEDVVDGGTVVRPTYKQCEERVNRVKTVINSWKFYFDRIAQNDTFGPPPQHNAALQKLLHLLLVQNYEAPQLSREDILAMSISLDPPKFGNYLKFHYAQQSPLMTGSYLPLIFTDTNPTYKLFAKSSLISAIAGPLSSSLSSSSFGSSSKRLVRSGTSRSSDGGMGLSSFYSHSGHSTISATTSSTLVSTGGTVSGGLLHRSNSFPPPTSRSAAMTTGVQDVDFFSREFVSRYASRHILMRNIRDVLNLGAKLFHINDDIVVKSLADDRTSRPSSMIEAPSRHLTTSSRRVSAQFTTTTTASPRTSLNAATTSGDFSKVFEQFASPSVNVVVKSANLERLVDILVLGVNGFASFVSPQDIDRPTIPEFRIDMNIHTLTFFATFRSFCSPVQLLTSLRKRFVGARSAAMSIVELNDDDDDDDEEHKQKSQQQQQLFPNWDPVCDIPLDNNRAWGIVAQIQIGVLEACHLWVSQYFSDFADDLTLKEQFLELTEVFGLEISMWKELQSSSQINEDYGGYLDSMEGIYKKVRNLFYKKSYRPNDLRSLIPNNPVGTKYDNLPVGNNSVIYMKLEKLIEDINIIASEYFLMVSVKEWLELFETLELQSSEITGFFHYTPPSSSNDDDIIIQDIFTYLETLFREKVPSEGKISEKTDKYKILEQFPSAIQELFRLRNNLVSYLIYQIADPLIHKDDRIQRMISILRILGIAKTRMTFLDIFPRPNDDEPETVPDNGISTSVPSFLETCVIAAILRPESRVFANSWMQASREIAKQYSRASPQSFTTLEAFVPTIDSDMLVFDGSRKPLTPCVGWMIERMMEIVCYVPNMSIENTSLINFDKRRYVYNLITNVSEMKGEDLDEDDGDDKRGAASSTGRNKFQVAAKKIAYIVNPDQTLYYIDKKTMKDSVSRDTKEYPRSYSKNRVFTSYTALEGDKLKRDGRQREFIERQYRDMKKSASKLRIGGISSSSASSFVSAMGGGSGSQGLTDGRKSQRSRFGGLFKAVRPISMAFSTSFVPSPDRVVSIYELPDMSIINDGKCKLLATINLGNCDISLIPNQNGNNGLFKVTIVDPSGGSGGSDLIFQGLSDADAAEWVRLATLGRRYSILRSQHQPSISAPGSPAAFTKVFGVPVGIVCEREGRDLPMVVEVLLNEIESRGLDEVGLYRVSGSLASVNALKAAFDSGDEVDMEDDRWFDINTVAGCFKLYLRELSEPLLTTELFPEFVKCGSATGEEAIKLLRKCINKLPSPNYNLLKRLLQHLGKVAEHEVNNKMKTPNLAIVFSMSFLPASAVDQMKAMQNVVNAMIICHDRLFSPVEDAESNEYGNEDGDSNENDSIDKNDDKNNSNDINLSLSGLQLEESRTTNGANTMEATGDVAESVTDAGSDVGGSNSRYIAIGTGGDSDNDNDNNDTQNNSPSPSSASKKPTASTTTGDVEYTRRSTSTASRDSFTEVSAY